MKNGRLFELLYLLVERRALTAGELAERFEVSERTIYRDVDALSAAGVPVYTQRGQGGGIRLMDQFVLDRCLLSPREQDEVLFALRALLSTGGLEGAEALERLSALFRREAEGWVEVDFTDWGKGFAVLNGFNLGRFWEKGPQKRLYIPAPLLKEGENELILFESEGKTPETVSLEKEPLLE